MERRRFGSTELFVSPMGLGCWGISGDWGPMDRETGVGIVRRACELGVNFFDTADMYGKGRSEELIGEALAGRRDEVVIASKGGMNFYEGERHLDFRPDYIQFALGETLRRLGTDYLDLYQLHNPRPGDLTDALFERLDRLRERGRIRYYGVSLNSRMEGFDQLQERGVASFQLIYNLADQRAAHTILPWAQAHHVAAIARVPLASGLLTGKYACGTQFPDSDPRRRQAPERLAEGLERAERLQFLATGGRTLGQAALRFVLAHPAVTVAIPGAKSIEQLEENVAALSCPSLAPDELSRIETGA